MGSEEKPQERTDKARTFSLVLGIAVIALGVVFLLTSLLGGSVFAIWWPLIVMIPGLAFFAVMLWSGRRFGFLGIPGCIITSTGLILFLQNLTGEWATWAYVWALVSPGSVGLGLYIWGRVDGATNQMRVGLVVARIGLYMFLGLGVFFELIIGLSDSLFMQIAWPVLLVLVGVWILVRPFVPAWST